jgi:diacylglycerol kinase family enzyme
MKLLVINNLSSGYGDGAIYDYLRMVASDGDELCIRCTDGTTEVADLLDDAERFDAVVAAGGDGTIAAISYRLAGSGIPILPFPAGTGNLLATNLLSPLEPHALAKMTFDMNTLDFDLGEIEAGGKRFGFGIMAGAGYDATIMHDAKPAKKTLGAIAYFQAAIANVMPQKSKIRLVIDGETIECEGLGILLVNFSRIQFDIPLTHGTDARDGTFEIAILKAENAFGLIPAFVAGILDRDGVHPDRTDSVEVHHGRVVEAYADPPLELQYDGELPGLTTPFKAHVLDGAARFILSKEAYDSFSRNGKH